MTKIYPCVATLGFAIFATLAGLAMVHAESSPRAADAVSSADTTAPSAAIDWRPHVGEAVDGTPVAGELGTIRVPERRRGGDDRGRTIEIAFVRYRTTHPDPGPPVFFLAGGPGGSGIDGAAVLGSHPQVRLLEGRDVIGVDQRGTGLSAPDLTVDVGDHTLPADRAVTSAEMKAAVRRAAEATRRHWTERGVDLDAYNTEESAADLDAVRRALGLPKIALWGTSYGSHLGLAYLRRFGDSVERAVLSKVEGPNHTFKLPSTVQHHLEEVHRLAAGDPTAARATPDVLGTVRALLEQLEDRPAVVEVDGQTVAIGPLDLQIALSRALASSQTVAEIPAQLRRLSDGDWSALAIQALDHRQVGIYAMALMMDCASGASPERWRRLDREARDPNLLLGDALLAPFYLEACRGAGDPDVGADFRSPLASDVPVLFVSGTLDVRTPPSNVEELLPGFPNARHLLVENAGHESRELMSPEFRGLLQAYLRGEPVDSMTISLPEPIFRSVEDVVAAEKEAAGAEDA